MLMLTKENIVSVKKINDQNSRDEHANSFMQITDNLSNGSQLLTPISQHAQHGR